MIIRVDPSSPTPVYEQLRAQIANMVTAGTLAVGQRLPTIRQLAGDLGLAKGTVSRAFELLEAGGLIVSNGRRGTIVAERPPRDAATSERMLRHAASAYALTCRQLGVTLDEALDTLTEGWELSDGASH